MTRAASDLLLYYQSLLYQSLKTVLKTKISKASDGKKTIVVTDSVKQKSILVIVFNTKIKITILI